MVSVQSYSYRLINLSMVLRLISLPQLNLNMMLSLIIESKLLNRLFNKP
jgi:hypothetical protein